MPALGQRFVPLGGPSEGTSNRVVWDLSADGSTVVGVDEGSFIFDDIIDYRDRRGFVFDVGTETLTFLPDPPPGLFGTQATGVNADGSIVVGVASNWTDPDSNGAFRYHRATGQYDLFQFEEGFTREHGFPRVSGDGNLLVGTAGPPLPTLAYVRDFATDSITYVPANGLVLTVGRNISTDGSTVVGLQRGGFERDQAIRYDVATGVTTPLGDLPGGTLYSRSEGVSANGRYVVGASTSSDEQLREAFLYDTADGTMLGLGVLGPGLFPGFTGSTAYGVSANGNVVVGGGDGGAFVWTRDAGLRSLGDVAREAGVAQAVLDGWNFDIAVALSDDGRTVLGYGRNPRGEDEQFVVTIPEPASAGWLVLAGLAFRARLAGGARKSRAHGAAGL